VGFTVRVIVAVLVRLPDIPWMVTVAGPIAATVLAVSINVLVAVAALGLNNAVTPLGSPDTDKLTLPLNPFCGVTVIVLVPLVPCVIVKLSGDAESEKFGPEDGQLFTKFAAFTLPMPVAKSHPVVVLYAGLNEVLEVESTPTAPPSR
jgi:hypothetical protein